MSLVLLLSSSSGILAVGVVSICCWPVPINRADNFDSNSLTFRVWTKATYTNQIHWDPEIAAIAQKCTDLYDYEQNNHRTTTFLEIDASSKTYSTFTWDIMHSEKDVL